MGYTMSARRGAGPLCDRNCIDAAVHFSHGSRKAGRTDHAPAKPGAGHKEAEGNVGDKGRHELEQAARKHQRQNAVANHTHPLEEGPVRISASSAAARANSVPPSSWLLSVMVTDPKLRGVRGTL